MGDETLFLGCATFPCFQRTSISSSKEGSEIKIKRSLTAGLATIVAVMGVASTASALTYSGTKYGQYTYTSGSFISIKDNAGDGKFPAVNTAIQPCISRPAPLPMDCGGWIY